MSSLKNRPRRAFLSCSVSSTGKKTVVVSPKDQETFSVKLQMFVLTELL